MYDLSLAELLRWPHDGGDAPAGGLSEEPARRATVLETTLHRVRHRWQTNRHQKQRHADAGADDSAHFNKRCCRGGAGRRH
uniref:Uncharacterized protein n=1 Tax=Setaria italica TaxID=4555 RepID=K3ZKP3_SETIT